jgi:hypothetical protein
LSASWEDFNLGRGAWFYLWLFNWTKGLAKKQPTPCPLPKGMGKSLNFPSKSRQQVKGTIIKTGGRT